MHPETKSAEHGCCHGADAAQRAAIDPVCGMTVDPAHCAGSVEHGGQTYYFCSTHCVARFRVSPETYLQKRIAGPSPAASGAAKGSYTCPMHPEIVQDGPGTCPICGMALEPMQPSADEGPDPELIAMQRRLWIGAILTVPIFLIAMGGLVPSERLLAWLHEHMAALNWVQLVLATPVVLWCGRPFFERAWQSVVNRRPNLWS